MRAGMAVRRVDGGASPAPAAPALRLVPPGAAAPGPGWLMRQCDRLFNATSLVSTSPLLDIRAFEWTCALRRGWLDVSEEAREVAADEPVRADLHPRTAAILAGIPGLLSAAFERIQPGVHATPWPRARRAVLTCQLGLDIPRCGDLRMRVGGRMVRWAEGETLLFDETQADARWNDSETAGLVLTVLVRRPLRQPGRWIADRLLNRP